LKNAAEARKWKPQSTDNAVMRQRGEERIVTAKSMKCGRNEVPVYTGDR
jgi:uncharacterized OB-fold protein